MGARKAGSKYISDVPCKWGHVGEWYYSTRECVLCVKERQAATYKKNRERILCQQREYVRKNQEAVRRAQKAWHRTIIMTESAEQREDRLERQRERQKRYRERLKADPPKLADIAEAARLRTRAWGKRNPGHVRVLSREKKRHVKLRTPAWVDKKALSAVYAACPEGFHVDHIVPLRGNTVSGLHVPWNLQYLPADENMKKSNKFEVA